MKTRDCERIRKEMALWLAGESDGVEVVPHLESCLECRRYFEQLQVLMADIEAGNKEIRHVMNGVDWDGLARQVTRHSMQAPTPRSSARKRWRLPLAAALFGFGLMTGYLIFHRGAERPSVQPAALQLSNSIRLVETAMDRREIVDFLGRMRLLLVELMHAPDTEADRQVMAAAAQRLLREYRYLGQNLTHSSIQEARGVMERFSWVLTELSYDPPPSPDRLAAVRRMVEQERLLLKVRLIERELEFTAREV